MLEEKINNLSSLIIKDDQKPIVTEIIKLLEKNRYTIGQAQKILDTTKRVLPIITVLNRNQNKNLNS